MTVRNVRDVVALDSSTPKLATLVAETGERPTMGVIKAFLGRMNDNMHLPNGLTPDNINDIAEYLVTEPEVTCWLTMADVRMLCRRIEDGAYMRLDNRFGKDDFHYCLGRYCGERREEHQRVAQKDRERYLGKTVEGDGTVADAVAVVRDAISHVVPAPPRADVTKDDRARKVTNTAKVLMQQRGIGWIEAIDLADGMVARAERSEE